MPKKMIRYSMQLAMLRQLLDKKLISEREYKIVKNKLMNDYKIHSSFLSNS